MMSMMNLAIIAIARSDVTMHNRAVVVAHGGVNIRDVTIQRFWIHDSI